MKKLIALSLVVTTMVLTGCVKDAEEVGGRFVRVDEEEFLYTDYGGVVVVDTETGVQYLWITSGYRGGVTAILNRDGTPQIAEGY